MKLPPNYGQDYTRAFEKSFAEIGRRYNVALLPFMLEGFAEKPEYFQADRIHPNEEAQPLILERVGQALRPLLK
jgi:acyl-CoA thioesterase-1